MASKFSCEFQIAGVRYLLASQCHYWEWPVVQSRVKTALIGLGKSVSQLAANVEPTRIVPFDPKVSLNSNSNTGQVEINSQEVHFELTINPRGNTFR